LRKPTIKDVARHADVSLKTVSRVINGESGVSAATRKHVQQTVETLGFRPNASARGLRSSHAYALGLVYDNPNDHYVISLQNGMLATCQEHGFGLQILPCNSESSELADTLIAAVDRSRLAGLVLTPPMSERHELLAALRANGIACVCIISAREDPGEQTPCVYVNDRRAAYAVTEHLIRLGHMRIGFLWGDMQHRSSQERYAGYVEALADYGVRLDEDLVMSGRFSFDDGFLGARRLLAMPTRPTAIFGSNDEIAAGVLAATRSVGLEVPRDLSIVGFEGGPFSSQVWPPLTTAQQSTHEIGRQAALRLMAELQQASVSSSMGANLGFVPELVIRGSTAPPPMA
jgi:LacI family transcriptional regulator